jgi:hypothetical protein
VIIAGAALLCAAALRAGVYPAYRLEDADQDARFKSSFHGDLRGRQAVFGDMDGDARPDALFALIFFRPGVPNDRVSASVSLIKGSPERWRGDVDILTRRTTNFFQFGWGIVNWLKGLVDWNGDGRADLVLSNTYLHVFWGRADFPEDMETKFGDLQFRWQPSGIPPDAVLASGDVNGDGQADLVVADAMSTSTVDSLYILPGGRTWNEIQNLYDLTDEPRWRNAAGSLRGLSPVYDVNGDGYGDVVLSRVGGVEVWRGSANPPTSRDVGADTPSLRVQGGAGASLEYALSGDLNGDGRREMVVCSTGAGGTAWWSLDGALVGSATGTVAMTALGPRRLRSGGAGDSLEAVGDFDGDGRADLVWSSTATGVATRTGVYLSADQPGEGEWTGEPSFTIEGEAGEEDEYHLVDMDGDGKDDLWIVQKPGGGSYRWHVNLFYGFRPLKNPRVAVGDREEGSKRATLALTVEGDPAEMRLSGDIEDEDRDQWIPYAAKRRVRWTGNAGAKTVRVSYRTAEGRESAAATASVGAREEGAAVRSVTNRLIGGEGAVELDCRVTGGWLRATVRERGGGVVRRIYDGAAEGLTTVKWDGRNEGGGRVRPGVYAVTLEFDGNRETRRVLVEP